MMGIAFYVCGRCISIAAIAGRTFHQADNVIRFPGPYFRMRCHVKKINEVDG
jgi:hypothetical protein